MLACNIQVATMLAVSFLWLEQTWWLRTEAEYILPVIQVPISLCQLRRTVDEMAAKEKVVARLDSHSIAHEDGTVARKSEGHTAGNTKH